MQTAIILAIFFGFGAALLNLASAGAAALLYLKRPDFPRTRRNLLATCLPGVISALLFGGIGAVASSEADSAGFVLIMILLFMGGIGALLSIPGAIVMSRLVERGPRLGDTFT